MPSMIKKFACVSAMAVALLASAPTAQAASPTPSSGAPGVPLLDGLLGSLEVGHPVTSPRTLLPAGITGR
jgi:hypothetical protein